VDTVAQVGAAAPADNMPVPRPIGTDGFVR